MAENNDFNLVISDEESVNVLSGRSPHNPYNQHGSPNVEFIRKASREGADHSSQKGVASPMMNAGITSYDQLYAHEAGDSEGYFDHDSVTSPKPNSEMGYTNYTGPNTDSSKKGQFIKKAKAQNSEPINVQEDHRQNNSFKAQQQAHHRENNHGYEDQHGHNEHYQDEQPQSGTEGYEYQDFGDFNGVEDSQNITGDDDDQRNQSLRDSQNAGPMRYSKMSEEEAARAFENRRKELFSTYLKKGPKKGQAPRPGPMPNEPGKASKSAAVPQEEPGFGKSTVNGFVIFNNRDNQTPNNPNKPHGRESAEKAQRRGQSTDKRDQANVRKDSPMGRNNAGNAQRQTPKPQKGAGNNAATKSKGATPRDYGNQRDEPKIQYDVKRSSSAKKKQNEQRIDYNSGYGAEAEEGYEEEQYYQDRDRPSYNQYNAQNHPQQNYQQRSQPQSQHHSVHQHDDYRNDHVAHSRKREILSDINSLDGEIQRLENEENLNKRGAKNRGNNVDYNKMYAGNMNNGYQQQHLRAKGDNPNNAQKPQQQKENPHVRGRSNSKEVQRGNSIDRNAKERGRENIYPVNQNIQDEREKRQKINQLKNDKGMRNTETSQGSIREQVQQSYMVLNERGFENHYDYLYERALVQRRGREALHERSREMRESQELIHCTFSPAIKQRSVPKREDIITQTKNWQISQERQQQINEKSKIEKELRECTFYPNGMLDKEDKFGFNSNDFYKRNIEWVKRRDADHMRKQNDFYKSIMSGPDRPKSHASLNVSRVRDSQILQDSKLNSPSAAPGEMSRLLRNPSNKSFRSARDTQTERGSSAKKRDDSEKKKRDNSAKKRDSVKPLNRSNISTSRNRPSQPQKSEKVETPVENRESVNHSNSLGNLNMQSHIMESYAILDNLQSMLTAKDREKQERLAQERGNVDKRLKTVNVQQPIDASKVSGRGSFSKAKTAASPRRSQVQQNGKTVITTVGFDPKALEGNTQSIMVRNNRYYIEERPIEAPKSRQSRERSRSTDSRRKGAPSISGKGNTSMRGGSYAIANQARKRVESPYRKKTNTQKYETSVSKISYSEPIASPMASLIGSPYSYRPFANGPSPRCDLNYVSKGLTSPTTQTLEKKYMDLLSQVNRVTNQIENINVENYTLQNDINSIQRKQMNKNLLYS